MLLPVRSTYGHFNHTLGSTAWSNNTLFSRSCWSVNKLTYTSITTDALHLWISYYSRNLAGVWWDKETWQLERMISDAASGGPAWGCSRLIPVTGSCKPITPFGTFAICLVRTDNQPFQLSQYCLQFDILETFLPREQLLWGKTNLRNSNGE